MNIYEKFYKGELLERFARVSCPENGLIFDLFAGSGSTAIAAMNNNRRFLGIEKSDEYFSLATKRINESEDEQNEDYTLF